MRYAASVEAGVRWFFFHCAQRALDPRQKFRTAVQQHYKGRLKAPFNDLARRRAGMPREYYIPLVDTSPGGNETVHH